MVGIYCKLTIGFRQHVPLSSRQNNKRESKLTLKDSLFLLSPLDKKTVLYRHSEQICHKNVPGNWPWAFN